MRISLSAGAEPVVFGVPVTGSRHQPREIQRLVFVATRADGMRRTPRARPPRRHGLFVAAASGRSRRVQDPVCRHRRLFRGDKEQLVAAALLFA
jgi:hypothetical protein